MPLTSINIYDVRGDHVLLFGYHKEFIFKEKGFFEIPQNKNPSKITRYTVLDKHTELFHNYNATLSDNKLTDTERKLDSTLKRFYHL